MPFLGTSCRDVSILVLAGEDRPLRWREKLAMRAHLFICDNCSRFSAHVSLMRGAMSKWRNYQNDE